jgi:hypothetical protein
MEKIMTIKMKMKAVLIAAMFATTGMAMQSAHADAKTFSLVYDADGSGSFSGNISNIFAPTDPANFDDKFGFTVDKTFDSGTSITSTFTQVGSKTKDLTITGFNLVRYNPVTLAVISVFGGTNSTPAPYDAVTNPTGPMHPTDSWSVTANGLSAGYYYVQVIGKIVGNQGGSYGGDISVLTASAVPETETYGMMLGGLALLGVVARRKAAKKAA